MIDPVTGQEGNPPAAELERMAGLLERAAFKFASTMPHNPHYYTLRWTWPSDQDFIDVVLFIRRWGVIERYPHPVKGRPYTVMRIGQYKYWTMGAPVGEAGNYDRKLDTILINRKPTEQH